jgi:hypothetical protein
MNRTISTHIQVGTRIHSILYGGRDGVVYAIHGQQSPESVRSIGGLIQTGGRADFDIVFDNGTESLRLPECILRGVQWRIYEEIATPAEIADMLNFAATEDVRKRNEAEVASRKFAEEVAGLKVNPKYAKLTQAGVNHGGGKLVAANLRIELKTAFPGVKFSIRSDYNSVRIAWTDGPTTEHVKAITGKYEGGHFDAMDDSYHHSNSPFTSVFGSAKYISENRSYSVATMTTAAEAVAKMYDYEPFNVKTSCDGTAYIDCTSQDHQRNVYAYLEQRYPFEKAA